MAHTNDDIPILIGKNGPMNGHRFQLAGDVLIGRDQNCGITISDRQISRYHARLTVSDDGVYLEDLDSKNGTHHNGQPIHQKTLLEDGDIIQIALAQQFLYVSSEATATIPLQVSTPGDTDYAFPQRLRLDKRSRRVWANGIEVVPPLSVSQFRLLETLYEHDGRVVERRKLIEIVWGDEDAVGVSEQALDALVRRLRDRLISIDPTHSYIITVRGHGLRFDNPAKS